jgi:hypothetical protein
MAAVGIEGRHFDQLTQLVHSADEAADEALRLLQVSGGGVQGI